ncbi:MAG: hypothetical protein R2750_06740 [Bacteroidales bacterium]
MRNPTGEKAKAGSTIVPASGNRAESIAPFSCNPSNAMEVWSISMITITRPLIQSMEAILFEV